MVTIWSDSRGQEIKMGAAAASSFCLAAPHLLPCPVLGPQVYALPASLVQLTYVQAVGHACCLLSKDLLSLTLRYEKVGCITQG